SRRDRPLVVDLSCLWAGPLAGGLLARCGAEVIKVESPARPDGARGGPPAFFDLLNAGKRSLALDLASPGGRAALARLVEVADLVIESSRPRAAEQLGLEPGRTGWVSVTGYGRSGPGRDWVAFGDDASAAAGLPAVTGGARAPVFCGDALADPAAGLHAAVAALALLLGRSSQLVEVALREVVGHMLIGARPLPPDPGPPPPVAPPRARRPAGPGPGLGQHTAEVLARLGCRPGRPLR
ncbi:MAG TPA: CoA transferase, partial [Acidimicrobiales bacterium]|nr:CoA transferase [Acidimicrobiales bacterium]